MRTWHWAIAAFSLVVSGLISLPEGRADVASDKIYSKLAEQARQDPAGLILPSYGNPMLRRSFIGDTNLIRPKSWLPRCSAAPSHLRRAFGNM